MSKPADRAYPWHDPRQARGRLILALSIGVAIGGLLSQFGWAVRLVAGWDAASATLLTLAWWIIARADPAATRRRAGSEDPGRTVVWVIVLLSSAFSLGAATLLLGRARTLAPEATGELVVLCLVAVACAWLLTHSAYTLRYARLYYRDDDEGVGGLDFPGKRDPDDLDFAYFAFTIGMCYQTSDVTVSSFTIRRTVLVHSVISFAYNTAILALALNLIFALFTS
jgi:uncharacterized membrane protein